MDKSVLVGKNRKALHLLEIPYTEMINHKRALFVLLTMILGKTTRNTSTRGIFHQQMWAKKKNFGENDVIIELRHHCERSFTLVALHYFSILCSWVFQISCPLSLFTSCKFFEKNSVVLTTNIPPTWQPCHVVASQEFIRNYLLFILSRTRRLLTQVLMIMLLWINRRKRRRKKMKMLMLPLTNRKNQRRWVAAMFYTLITIK